MKTLACSVSVLSLPRPLRPCRGAVLLVSLCVSFAQGADFRPTPSPLPEAPLLSRPPDPSSWSIRFLPDSELISRKSRENNSPAGENTDWFLSESPDNPESRNLLSNNHAQIQRIHHINSGKFQGFELDYGHGVSQKFFSYGGYLLFDHPKRDEVLVVSPQDARDLDLDYRADRFQDLEWITPEAYRGMTRFQGRDCYVYELVGHQLPDRQSARMHQDHAVMGLQLEEVEKSAAPSPPGSVLATALVDRQTRLPVLLRRGGDVLFYEFHPAGTRLELPPRYEKALREHLDRMERRQRRYRIPQ